MCRVTLPEYLAAGIFRAVTARRDTPRRPWAA
jgi:hypothetical protein